MFSLRFRMSRKLGRGDPVGRPRVDVGERPRGPAVLGVGGVEEVHLAVFVDRDVLQVGVGLGGGVVDDRLVLGVEPEGLGEAAVLRGVHPPAGHQGDEVVLGGLAASLGREGRGRLAGAGQAHDQDRLVLAVDRDDLAAGVQGQAAAVVDDVVPHPQPALLGLAEVVRVEHAGDVAVQVDGDEPVVGVAGGLEVGCVDDRGVRLPGGRVVAGFDRVVELLLHAGHVRVGRLHDQPRPGAELRIGSDIAVDHDHVGLGDMRVLDGCDALIFGPGNGLPAGVGGVIDDVGGPGATRVDAGLNRNISELCYRGVGHFLGQLAQPGRRGIPLHPRAAHLVRHRRSSSWPHTSRRALHPHGHALAGTRGACFRGQHDFVDTTRNRKDYCPRFPPEKRPPRR